MHSLPVAKMPRTRSENVIQGCFMHIRHIYRYLVKIMYACFSLDLFVCLADRLKLLVCGKMSILTPNVWRINS